jgi:hypothetical protein
MHLAAVTPVDTRPVTAVALGALRLDDKDQLGRDWVSSASGIAAVHGSAWVVSDELGDLARFTRLDKRGSMHAGLPKAPKKPDLESVVWLPAADGAGLLFAAGSGSSEHRDRGVVRRIDAHGATVGSAKTIDLAPLYRSLAARLPHGLNVEGMALHQARAGAELLVFHRGRLAGDVNTIFRLDGAAVLAALAHGDAIPPSAVRGQQAVELGSRDGARLAFSDARALPDGRIAFVASAEGSDDAASDGAIHGSVLGMLDADLHVTALRPVAGPPRKIEGIERAIELDPTAPANRFVLVTDPDDPARQAELLTADLD